MMTLYLVALAIGGTLLMLTLFLGGDSDASGDVADAPDVDAEMDAGAEGGMIDAVSAWLPLSSVRFWIFFLADFGLAGVLLTQFTSLPNFGVAILATAVGYAAGLFMTRLMAGLSRGSVDSKLESEDWIGTTAHVIVPIKKGQLGKIRVTLKGQIRDATATSEQTLGVTDTVVIYSINDEGVALVERADQSAA